MSIQVAALAGALALVAGALAATFVLGMRSKSPLVLGPLIWLQRRVINPRQMRSAGSPGAYAAVIHHRGRTSGRSYQTPVGVVSTDDGFFIALPYGSRTQWVRNVLAGGSATLEHEGRTYAVDQPEIIPMQVARPSFPAGDQRGFRWLRTDLALRVRRLDHERFGLVVHAPPRGPAIGATRPMGTREVA